MEYLNTFQQLFHQLSSLQTDQFSREKNSARARMTPSGTSPSVSTHSSLVHAKFLMHLQNWPLHTEPGQIRKGTGRS